MPEGSVCAVATRASGPVPAHVVPGLHKALSARGCLELSIPGASGSDASLICEGCRQSGFWPAAAGKAEKQSQMNAVVSRQQWRCCRREG